MTGQTLEGQTVLMHKKRREGKYFCANMSQVRNILGRLEPVINEVDRTMAGD